MTGKRRGVHPIACALARERIRQGLTQKALARRMGLKAGSSVHVLESGIKSPGLSTLDRWASALGVSLSLTRRAEGSQ